MKEVSDRSPAMLPAQEVSAASRSALFPTTMHPLGQFLRNFVTLSLAVVIMLMTAPAMAATWLVGALHQASRHSKSMTGAIRWMRSGIETIADRVAPFILRDTQDADVLPLMAIASVAIIPSYFFMLFSGEFHPALAFLYLALLMGSGMRMYVAAFSAKHREAHRGTFFKGRLGKLFGRYCERVIGVFYGNVPGLEYPTHVVIHHGEHATDDPLDVTRYNRMHFSEFLRYLVVGSLYTNSGIGPMRKLRQMGKRRLFRVMGAGVVGFYLFAAFSLWINWRVALACLIVPLFTNIFSIAVVIWAQHGFVDPDDLENPFKAAVTLLGVESPGNENFHMTHHVKPAYPWRELPRHFADHEAELARIGHVAFHGLKLIDIWLLMCVRKRHDLLTAHLVSPPIVDRAEALRFLRRQMGWVRSA